MPRVDRVVRTKSILLIGKTYSFIKLLFQKLNLSPILKTHKPQSFKSTRVELLLFIQSYILKTTF